MQAEPKPFKPIITTKSVPVEAKVRGVRAKVIVIGLKDNNVSLLLSLDFYTTKIFLFVGFFVEEHRDRICVRVVKHFNLELGSV